MLCYNEVKDNDGLIGKTEKSEKQFTFTREQIQVFLTTVYTYGDEKRRCGQCICTALEKLTV